MPCVYRLNHHLAAQLQRVNARQDVWTCSHVQCSHVLLTGSEMLMTSSSATLTTNQCSTWLNEMIVVQIFKSLYLKNYLSNLDGVLTTIFVELPSTKLSIWISFLKLISNSSSYLRDDWRLCRFIVPKISLLILSNTCWRYLARSANLPEGIYILLALISSFFNMSKALSIYWTDFHNLFTKWKIFAWIFLIRYSFSYSSRDVAMATNFVS